ncbi:hypothetical protein SKAU_G00272630 [Synaphobranchus kaupii]|uniref:Uncharacterized protein n=1 Tax=Synaphobranchus kaupii TaxID=118154 RepID=A0A9Q1IQR0_SYNKA|nr:hypothetical protein SKAU_G00272630 [Synaphobranchus kaupii]
MCCRVINSKASGKAANGAASVSSGAWLPLLPAGRGTCAVSWERAVRGQGSIRTAWAYEPRLALQHGHLHCQSQRAIQGSSTLLAEVVPEVAVGRRGRGRGAVLVQRPDPAYPPPPQPPPWIERTQGEGAVTGGDPRCAEARPLNFIITLSCPRRLFTASPLSARGRCGGGPSGAEARESEGDGDGPSPVTLTAGRYKNSSGGGG